MARYALPSDASYPSPKAAGKANLPSGHGSPLSAELFYATVTLFLPFFGPAARSEALPSPPPAPEDREQPGGGRRGSGGPPGAAGGEEPWGGRAGSELRRTGNPARAAACVCAAGRERSRAPAAAQPSLPHAPGLSHV